MIIAVFLLFIISVIIVFTYDYYVHHSRAGRLINQIPGLKRIPIFGNVLQIPSPEKHWWLLHSLLDKYYPIAKMWAVFIPIVSIRHPDNLEVILNNTKHIEKSIIYKTFVPWLNTGLLTSGGIKWHSRRKMLTPAFHFNILRQYVNVLIEEGIRMTKALKDIGGTIEKDVFTFTSEHTLNAICETAMGTALHNLGAAQEEYRQKIRQLGSLIIYRATHTWYIFEWLWKLSSAGRQEKKILQHLHGFTEKIIAERKLYHEQTNGRYLQTIEDDNATEIGDIEIHGRKKKRLAMLDLLIAASREYHLTDLDIREEVDTFTFEGHDTTAAAISCTLLLLAEHKEIQDRVREEINTVMEQFGEKLTMTSLQHLTYLERCLKESMRLYPSVHSIVRVVAEDVQLRSYVIPKGTDLHINIFGVHRDANFWPNPEVFDPDRFLPEKIQNRHPYSYLPFSAGPRNCIGQRFAMLEMKAMIAPLVRNFYLEPVDYLENMRIIFDLVLRSKYPMHVKFVPIQHN